ncbi:MAG: hypothetical protein JO030_08095 [Candidatus Eremiobacteraeota bacterium]|nr:hypothetical protein [Candidatus Eremiobacteraeota bacterium]
MLLIAVLLLGALRTVVAQVPPEAAMPPMPSPPMETGACLDSARPVPKVLQAPVVRSLQIVRIDEVISTATMMPNQIVGFLYTTADGATWLGQRSPAYTSPASAGAINQILASTHLPNENATEFPPESRYGVPTRYPRFFQVKIAPGAMEALRFRLQPCVAWPPGRALPDPML